MGMKFNVGPWVYRVRIATEKLSDVDGHPAAALCLWDERAVLISDKIPAKTRVDVLAHELRHAWQNHLGRPGAGDDEGDANNASSFSVDFMRQLARQGGEAALMRLTPDGIVDSSEGPHDLAAEVGGAQCAGCGGGFSPVQIVTEPAAFNTPTGSMHIIRSLYCDFCGHVQRWAEGATSLGAPNGQILGSPRLLRGEAVNEYLRRHGATCGMVSA
jgi:hypothetical protein